MSASLSVKTAQDLVSEKLREARAVWNEAKGSRIAPKRDEITPAALVKVLPWIWFVDVIDGGTDFRFRLAGDRVIQFMGRRYAGEKLSQHLEVPFFQGMRQLYAACTEQKAPVAAGPMRTNLKDRDYLELEVIALPLSEDAATITGIFGAIDLRQIAARTPTR